MHITQQDARAKASIQIYKSDSADSVMSAMAKVRYKDCRLQQ